MTGSASADLVVARLQDMAVAIAAFNVHNALDADKNRLSAPEAATAQSDGLLDLCH
jgi:hypothetical protein